MKIFYGKAVYGKSEVKASLNVLKKKSLTLIDGPSVKILEKKIAHTFGKKFGLMVNSGSSANLLMAESLKDEIRQSLDTLKDRERQVIKMYFGIDRDYALTLNEIGEEFSLTRERVRQIKEKAIRRLRHRSRSKSLRTYLG